MPDESLRTYSYDAWNRPVIVKRAWRDPNAALTEGDTIATIEYDGLGRRIVKAIDNSADWDITYHTYYDPPSSGRDFGEASGQRMIETRNGSEQVLKQHVWGLSYIDELVQIAMNQDPDNADTQSNDENICERFFWTAQDANFNVLGVVNAAGLLVERYEDTPYGQRTIYSHGWSPGDLDNNGALGVFCPLRFVPIRSQAHRQSAV